ncbi:unnamed protein product, partial [Rotaria sp. Silwood1]
MEFNTYRAIIYGIAIGIYFIKLVQFLLLPNRLMVKLIEKLFDIVRIDKTTWTMNFYGIQMNYLASRRFRVSLIVQVTAIGWITIFLLVDGWIMQVQYLSQKDDCPQQKSDCFTIPNIYSNKRLICEPGQTLSNATSSNIICFVW